MYLGPGNLAAAEPNLGDALAFAPPAPAVALAEPSDFTEGDPGKTMVTVKRIDERTVQETDTRQGKVTDVIVSKVSADGKSLHVVDHDKLHGQTMTYTAQRQ